MAKGTVKWFDPKKGFGFVVGESGKDIFVHYSSIDSEGFRFLRNDQVVEYRLDDSEDGLKAAYVRLLSDPSDDVESPVSCEPPHH